METVQAGVIADLIKKLFFSAIDNIFDRAVEYKNDMGVLKQINKVAVRDANGDGHVIEISLSPIKDRDSEYVVDIKCNDIEKLKGVSRINGKAMKIDKSNMKEFAALIKKILKSNKLEWVEDKAEAQKIIDGEKPDKSEGDKKVIEFYYEADGKEDAPVVTVTRVLKPLKDGKVELTVTSEPNLTTAFPSGDFKNKDKAESRYLDWIDENLLVPKSERDKEAARAKASDLEAELAKGKNKKENKSDIDSSNPEGPDDASSSIYVGLKKVVNGSSEIVEITHIYASDYYHANDVVESLLDDDEFFDSINEEERTFKVDEDEDDIVVEECEFPTIS